MLKYGVYCDECGKEIKPREATAKLDHRMKIGSRIINAELEIGDLCKACREKIIQEGIELLDCRIE